LLLTVPGMAPVEYWSWHLHPSESYVSHPHPGGVREVITVVSGTLLLTVNGETHEVPAGATVLFVADRAHGYAAGEECCAFLMQVHLPASHGTSVNQVERTGDHDRR
jgi:quercetin dioxygenase-like cupin family protein